MENNRLGEHEQHQAAMTLLVTRQEFAIVSMLNPKVFIDGNQWCVLYGDNLQDGVAGCGDSPLLAVWDFNKSWEAKLNKTRVIGATLFGAMGMDEPSFPSVKSIKEKGDV